MSRLVLGQEVDSGNSVSLEDFDRRQGVYIIGKTGTGKSTLLQHLVAQDMKAGAGLCVLDPHGDLVDGILPHVPAERERDVILLDAADSDYPFGLNLFECSNLADVNLVARIATQSVEIFQKLWGDSSWGPRVAQILRNCAYTLIEHQGYTIAEIPRLLLDREFREALTSTLTNQAVRKFWELQYNPRRAGEQLDRIESTLNKVDEFLTPTVLPIVGMGRTTVDLRRAMDDGKILLVKFALGEVGARTVRLLGSVLVAQILNAALSRQDQPPEHRRQFNLYADEYPRFATPSFAELLAEARKFALATTLAHQFRGQLEDDANRGATLNAANLIVFAVHGEDADELAKQFDRTPPEATVVSERAKRAIVQDPVRHLVRNGHAAENVRYLTQHLIRPLVVAADESPSDQMYLYLISEADSFKDGGGYHAHRDDLKQAIDFLNRYFVDAMEGKVSAWSEAEMRHVALILWVLRSYLGFHNDYILQSHPIEGGRYLVADWKLVAPSKAIARMFATFIVQFGKLANRTESSKRTTPSNALYDALLLQAHAQVDRATVGDQEFIRLVQARALETYYRTMEFLAAILQLARSLAVTPILADTGQWAPVLERPRSYADIEDQIGSELVNLPKFHARCRLQAGASIAEYSIVTPTYRGAPSSPSLIDRLREHSRRAYCAPRQEIERQIGLRQAEGRGGATQRRAVLPE